MPVTNYLWDEVNDTLLAETDEAGNTIVEYTHEPGLHGPLISQRRNGHTYYHHYDGQGSTRALTGESGHVTDTYTYDAWGNQVAHTEATENPFRWIGQFGYYFDDALDTYYVRARVYAPEISRWMSQDPTVTPAANSYQYCLDNPVAYVDSNGAAPATAAATADSTTNIINWALAHGMATTDSRGCVSLTVVSYRYIAEQVLHYPPISTDKANDWLLGCVGFALSMVKAAKCPTTNGSPESIPHARCFDAAHAGTWATTGCPAGYNRVAFVKQGKWRGEPPTPGVNGEVPCDSVIALDDWGDFNYISFMGANGAVYWEYMNHCKLVSNGTGGWRCATPSDPPNAPENPADPQEISFCTSDPTSTIRKFPVSIYIVACCKCQ